MSTEKTASSSLPELPSTPDSVPSTLTVPDGAAGPVSVHPEAFVEVIQRIERLIPGYLHLSVEDQRSMLRVAFLDPEFIRNGVEACSNWGDIAWFFEWHGDEVRGEEAEILRWDAAIRRFRIVLEGMEGANLRRKHRLGRKMLAVYKHLKNHIDEPAYNHLLPWFEAMQRASRKKKKPEPSRKPEEQRIDE